MGGVSRNETNRASHWIKKLPLYQPKPILALSTAPRDWQEGYGAFSVSKSQEPTVKAYIVNHAEHHRKRDFKAEFLELLRAHGAEFDERYVLD